MCSASQGLTLIAKSAVTISFTIIGLFNAELLPTIIRKIGVSTASVIGAMGGMLAPYIVQVVSNQQYYAVSDPGIPVNRLRLNFIMNYDLKPKSLMILNQSAHNLVLNCTLFDFI